MVEIERKLLQDVAVFGALTEDTLSFLLGRAVMVRCANGQYVFREGDAAQSVYVLESGRVAVLKHWEGREYLLDYLEAGACFGEMALMDMHPRSASVLAVEDVLAFKIGASSLLELYRHNLEQFTLLQMNLGREVSRRLRDADERMFRWRVNPRARTEVPGYPEFGGG